MRAIMAVKAEKASMSILSLKRNMQPVFSVAGVVLVFLIGSFTTDSSCYVNAQDQVINLSLPAYIKLKSTGGYVYLDGGMRGIILYRAEEDVYYAFERACPHHPRAACAQVKVNSSNLYMEDTCCGSTFDFRGQVTGGPARYALQRYETYLEGNMLTVSSQLSMD